MDRRVRVELAAERGQPEPAGGIVIDELEIESHRLRAAECLAVRHARAGESHGIIWICDQIVVRGP